MKKSGLFKILLGIIVIIAIASWFLNASLFDAQNNEIIALKTIFNEYYGLDLSIQIGFFDIFKLIFATLMHFSDKFIFILSVGAFYGVLARTGKYRAWIEKVSEKFKGNEKTFLITSSIVLLIISSLTNYGMLFLIFIPILIGIVLGLGYDKLTAFITTFGAVILGELGSTFGYNITGNINETLGTALTTGLGYKLIFLVFGIVFLIIYILKAKHTKSDSKCLDEFVGEKNSNKYSVASLFVVFGILFVLLVLGCTYWSNFVNVEQTTIFENFHNKIMATKVAKTELFKNLNGTYYSIFFASNQSIEANPAISALGYWGIQEMSIILLLISLLIGRLYRLKHSEILNSMVSGVKKMLVPALLVLLSHVIILASQYYYPTIADAILNLTSKFNLLTSSFTMMLGTLFNIDISYIVNNAIPQIVGHGGNTTLLMLMSQSIYGVISLIAPTSLMLIIGLSYLEIPYTEYIKRMWKYILILLAVVIAFLLILSFIL